MRLESYRKYQMMLKNVTEYISDVSLEGQKLMLPICHVLPSSESSASFACSIFSAVWSHEYDMCDPAHQKSGVRSPQRSCRRVKEGWQRSRRRRRQTPSRSGKDKASKWYSRSGTYSPCPIANPMSWASEIGLEGKPVLNGTLNNFVRTELSICYVLRDPALSDSPSRDRLTGVCIIQIFCRRGGARNAMYGARPGKVAGGAEARHMVQRAIISQISISSRCRSASASKTWDEHQVVKLRLQKLRTLCVQEEVKVS
jgi:hypothetical protein